MLQQGKQGAKLFSPLDLRSVRLKNRIVISPMAQYCAQDGFPTDWHFAHLGSFATGGAGLIFTESTKVEQRGLGSFGDLGLWDDNHIEPLRRITAFIKTMGAAPGMQLNHSGRKARSQRPWEGFGPIIAPENELWPMIAPSAAAHSKDWPVPREMTMNDISEVIAAWVAATRRAHAAGFEVLEIHGAHGYLVHQFLSSYANHRTDSYGGSLKNRMRFPLELTEAIRSAWPSELPLFFRVSAVDDAGWTLEDTVHFSRELKTVGVDVIDCSSGGMASRSPTASQTQCVLGYQVPYAESVRKNVGIPAMAVGLIVSGSQAEAILANESADLVAIGRQALYDPFWATHAAEELGVCSGFETLPEQYGWWLDRRKKAGYPRAVNRSQADVSL